MHKGSFDDIIKSLRLLDTSHSSPVSDVSPRSRNLGCISLAAGSSGRNPADVPNSAGIDHSQAGKCL